MAKDRGQPRPWDLEQLQETMERVGEADERMEKLLRVAAVDPDAFSDLRDLYQQKASRVVTKDVFYPYRPQDGAFEIGRDPDGRRIGLTREQVNEHLLLVGKTGSGKTTFFYNLMATCAELDVPFLVFDFKNDYRHLVQDQDLLVINWRDFKFNPLQPPPGVQPGKWGEVLADTFAHATDLLIGSESYLLEQLRRIYTLYESGSTAQYPSLFELRDLVAADQISKASPKYKYKERVASRLGMMTGFSGDIFDCSQGYPIAALLDRNVALELAEPNQYVTNFVVEALLTWLFYYRDAAGQRQGLRHLIMFDEAKRVFDVNRSRQPASGYPPIDDLVGKIREFGEGLVVADHEPSKLSDSLKANTHTKLWLTLGSGTDIQEMARTYGLAPEEVEHTQTMPKGEGLLKLADRDPVPIHLPDYSLEKTMTEGDIRAQMTEQLAGLDVVARVHPTRYQQYIGGSRTDEGAEETDGEAEASVGAVAETLLASVNDQPFLGISDRYKAIGVDTKKGNRAKQELLTLGLVREVEIRTRTRGRNPKLLELTSEGRRILADRGHDLVEGAKGGIEHRWWQQKIAAYYADRGYETTIEYALGQQSIDVYAERPGHAIAVEVALSRNHELENVRKCLGHDPDRIQIVYTNEKVKDAIQADLQDEFGEIPAPVSFSSVKEFA